MMFDRLLGAGLGILIVPVAAVVTTPPTMSSVRAAVPFVVRLFVLTPPVKVFLPVNV